MSMKTITSILATVQQKMSLPRKHNKRTHKRLESAHSPTTLAAETAVTPSPVKSDVYVDEFRQFDAFAGEWFDSKGQTVFISAWGVIRYPSNAKLRFEAKYIGPNVLSVTFDRDRQRRAFVARLNHAAELLIWSNETKWTRKGTKHVPAQFANPSAAHTPAVTATKSAKTKKSIKTYRQSSRKSKSKSSKSKSKSKRSRRTRTKAQCVVQ